VIAISGDADVGAALDLEQRLEELARTGARTVTVDLSGATLIDSRTMGVLVGWDERLRSQSGALPIVCPNPNVLRMLATMGLDQSLAIYPSHAEAAAAQS
jgi:anti-sigma B factor antagonist